MKKMPTMTFWQLVTSKIIRIPIIQRDYAQGRTDHRVKGVRNKFLQALHGAVSGKKTLLLDFVYGEDEKGSFVPFDGQQRLTTLFLLHWYAVAREKKLTGHTAQAHYLKNFRYEVRDGARLFGQKLVECPCPTDHPVILPYDEAKPQALSEFIKDQSWFRPNWVHDPTIMGMLTMLDAIHGQFHAMQNLWDRLVEERNPPVSFFFEQLKGLGSSAEDIFIKMNARGKQLTDFEHFKAQFLDHLTTVLDPKKVNEIALKLDNEWMDVFWFLFARDADVEDKAAVADACFSRYFAYASDVLNGLPRKTAGKEAPEIQPDDLFECIRSALDPGREKLCPEGNLHFLIASLDKLHELFKASDNNYGIGAYFDTHFAAASPESLPISGKISLFGKMTNLFTLCCENSLSHANRFMLTGCLLALTSGLEYHATARRLRILRNILEHSSSELVEAYNADQIRGVYSLVVKGQIEVKSRFNRRQIEEEIAKNDFRSKFPNDSTLHDALDYLEDHPLLRGRLAIFSQKDHAGEGFCFERQTVFQGKRFFELAFGKTPVTYDTLVKGWLSQDDYALRGGARRYLGSQNAAKRQDIFATPDQEGFPHVRSAVQSLAVKTAVAKNSADLERMVNSIADIWAEEQQAKGQMDWRYYFVKYPMMRPDYSETQGFYHWGYGPKSFKQLQLSRTTRRSWHWSPFLWTAYVEAGVNDNNPRVVWEDCQGSQEWPLQFTCGLALWWDEFFWVIGNRQRGKKLTSKQATLFEKLRKQFPDIDEEGRLLIPGEDSDLIDYEDVLWEQHRRYDTEDRIQLILPVIKALV